MGKRFFKVPRVIRNITPSLTWKVHTASKGIYLTFDDGPIPELTEKILDILEEKEVKATFFMVGDNVRKHPAIASRVLDSGHSVGNHTFNHMKAWKNDRNTYLENIEKCTLEMQNVLSGYTPQLFRPPYGQIRPTLIPFIKRNYQIIMWDLLSYDFDINAPLDLCKSKLEYLSRSGTITVFHDNYKAQEKVLYLLPWYIDAMRNKGFVFYPILNKK